MTSKPAPGAALAAVLGTFLTSGTAQTTYSETEPNDLKSQANGPFVLLNGDRIAGSSSATSDSDYWILQSTPQPAGIYEHELSGLTGTMSDASLRGLQQTGGVIDPASDFPVQLGSPGYLRWYGFGRSERVYLRKVGSMAEAYTFRYTRRPVTPAKLPEALEAGFITIETTGLYPADLWIYDSELRAIRGYGNDDGPATTESVLDRSYSFEPGIYYLAVTTGRRGDPVNLANDQPSPFDDANRNGTVLEFPDAIACREGPVSLDTLISLRFTHGDPARTTRHSATMMGSAYVYFLQFRVVPQNAIPSVLSRGSSTIVQQNATTPDVAVTGQDLYMSMQLDLGGNRVVGLRHSPDRGQTFSGPTTAIPGSTNGVDPDVEADGSHVAVGYAGFSSSGVSVDVAASPDSGNSWGVTTLTTGGFGLTSPDLALGLNGALSVLYRKSLSAALHEIVYRESTDYGASFGAEVTVSPAGVDCSDPSIARWGNLVFATWTKLRPTPGIQGRYSRDGGSSWFPILDLAPILGAGGNAQPEAAIAADGTVGVTYLDIGPGHTHEDVYFMQSTGTASFSSPVCVSRSGDRTSLVTSISAQWPLFHITYTEDDFGTFRTFHSSAPVGSRVPPSLPVRLAGSGSTMNAFSRAAGADDFFGVAYAQGSAQTDVVLHMASGLYWHGSLGNGGCAGEFGVPVMTVRGDLGSGFTLNLGPAEPNAFTILGLAAVLASDPVSLGGGCWIDLDPASTIAVGVMTDATGNYSLQVPFGLTSEAFLQAAVFDQRQSFNLSFPVGLNF